MLDRGFFAISLRDHALHALQHAHALRRFPVECVFHISVVDHSHQILHPVGVLSCVLVVQIRTVSVLFSVVHAIVEHSVVCLIFARQILALDSAPLKNWRDQRDMLIGHLKNLRAHKVTSHVPIILAVESNLGFEAAHNGRYVTQAGIQNVHIAQETKTNGRTQATLRDAADTVTGIRTTNQTKEHMYILLRSLLEESELAVWSEMMSQSDSAQQIKKVVRQMHNYSAVHTDPNRVFAQTKRVFTGKAMGEQDDLLIALQLAIMYRKVYIRACAQPA